MALLDTLQEKREEILAIAAQHGAFNVRIFGSVIRREDTPERATSTSLSTTIQQKRHLGSLVACLWTGKIY
ncbi:MAG: hypothetical protein ACFB0D_05075 [Phormidesmis sp.]